MFSQNHRPKNRFGTRLRPKGFQNRFATRLRPKGFQPICDKTHGQDFDECVIHSFNSANASSTLL